MLQAKFSQLPEVLLQTSTQVPTHGELPQDAMDPALQPSVPEGNAIPQPHLPKGQVSPQSLPLSYTVAVQSCTLLTLQGAGTHPLVGTLRTAGL